MSDFDRNIAARGGYAGQAAAVDAGLRAHMIRVYNYMAAAVALSGAVAWLTFNAAVTSTGTLTPFGAAVFGGPLMLVLMLGTLGLVFFISFRIQTLSFPTAFALFFIYAGLLGVTLAPIFMVYTGASITRVFFISAASFGALSLWGYTTQRDLTGMGTFLFGVLVFAGLTAWDTQKIKEMYSAMDDGTVAGRKAIMGALSLYLDFINLFLMLHRLAGDRR